MQKYPLPTRVGVTWRFLWPGKNYGHIENPTYSRWSDRISTYLQINAQNFFFDNNTHTHFHSGKSIFEHYCLECHTYTQITCVLSAGVITFLCRRFRSQENTTSRSNSMLTISARCIITALQLIGIVNTKQPRQLGKTGARGPADRDHHQYDSLLTASQIEVSMVLSMAIYISFCA